MDNAPIGIFDSGLGGLTVARAVIDQLPDEDIVYLGDTAHAPYGPRPIAEVLHRHFGYPRPTCEALTLQVHSDGKAIIATGLRERVEADLQTLHDYGVQSTLERVT